MSSHANLRWTDAGREALADAAHVGTAAVKLTHLALGDGRGPGGAADDAREALRSERHRAAVAGTDAVAGRIAFRADFAPDASYSVTEAGVFGTAGDPPGAAKLLMYWSDGGAEAGKAAAGTDLAIAAVIDFSAEPAEVAVTVAANIVFGNVDPATESEFGSTRYATGEETGDKTKGDRAVTPKGLHAAAGKVLATLLGSAPGDGTVYQLKGKADGTIVVEARTQDGASSAGIAANMAAIRGLAGRVAALEGKTGAATTATQGVVELATSEEAKTGTDAARAVTPKAMRDSTSKNLESLLTGSVENGKRYALQGAAAGGLKLVLSSLLLCYAGDLGGVLQSAVTDGTAVQLDGASSWTIPEAGDWMVVAGTEWSGGIGFLNSYLAPHVDGVGFAGSFWSFKYRPSRVTRGGRKTLRKGDSVEFRWQAGAHSNQESQTVRVVAAFALIARIG